MNPTQCKMARAALGWSRADLAAAAGVAQATVERFELGDTIEPGELKEIRSTFAVNEIKFTTRGERSGVSFLRGDQWAH
jgi:transcriptional regulator with XRE-family HTH domain